MRIQTRLVALMTKLQAAYYNVPAELVPYHTPNEVRFSLALEELV
jgi:hypothetical protein